MAGIELISKKILMGWEKGIPYVRDVNEDFPHHHSGGKKIISQIYGEMTETIC